MVNFENAERLKIQIEERIKMGKSILHELMYHVNPGFMEDESKKRLYASDEELQRINQEILYETERQQLLGVLPSDNEIFDLTEKLMAMNIVQYGRQLNKLGLECKERAKNLKI